MKTAAAPQPITYSCYRSEYTKSEHFVEDHVLGHVVSGTMEFQLAGHKVTCQEGDYYFVGRNQFTKAAKNLRAMANSAPSPSGSARKPYASSAWPIPILLLQKATASPPYRYSRRMPCSKAILIPSDFTKKVAHPKP